MVGAVFECDCSGLTLLQPEFNDQAEEMLFQLVKQMAKAEGVDEELKRRDQLGWVQMMNSIRSRAEEIVLNELIYQ